MKSAIELAQRESKKITKQNKMRIQYNCADVDLDNGRVNEYTSVKDLTDLTEKECMKNNEDIINIKMEKEIDTHQL